MKKALLSLLILASSSFVFSNNDLEKVINSISAEDLEKPMGDLGDLVKDVSEEELLQLIKATNGKIRILKRLLREQNIAGYKKENRQSHQKALVEEFTGKAGAIKGEFENNTQENQKEEDSKKSDLWNGSLGWIWYSEATSKSFVGRENKEIEAVKNTKNSINKENHDLVLANKDKVLSVLEQDLKHQNYLVRAQYLNSLNACGGDAECLFKRRINWNDVQTKDFFAGFERQSYEKTAAAAQEVGITVSIEDIKKIAEKNQKTASLVEKLQKAENEANAVLHKILHPELEEKKHIDLNNEHEQIPSLDAQENQNN